MAAFGAIPPGFTRDCGGELWGDPEPPEPRWRQNASLWAAVVWLGVAATFFCVGLTFWLG